MFFFTNMIDFPFFAQYFYYFVISAKIEICFPFYRVIISIHAPHVGARPFMSFSSCYSVNISIHAPRVGARPSAASDRADELVFQSTRPAWGRDLASTSPVTPLPTFQSTRPAWGRDMINNLLYRSGLYFNPRAPRGGATVSCLGSVRLLKFQSTRPAWGRDRWSC